ncbi:lysozyme family protein [Streptococcus plurextorum]|uniref:lysozyme family protein n=1 Tax=Streptococcus plurextorum TaxID=456876 RepID=UPI000427603B|nr:lysozyme family protein [Streptococcus plurextorum]
MLKKLRRLLALLFFLGMLIWGFRTHQAVQRVLTYREMVREVLAENDSQANEDLVLAMIYTESKGDRADIMQSSESSTGQVNTITDSRESVRQGVTVLSDNLEKAEQAGVDVWTAVQAYNFGSNYIRYVAENGGVNSLELAKHYSKEVVAPSLGNNTGKTYPYHNLIAYLNGGAELYQNGGNFYYSRQVQANLYLIKVFNLFS